LAAGLRKPYRRVSRSPRFHNRKVAERLRICGSLGISAVAPEPRAEDIQDRRAGQAGPAGRLDMSGYDFSDERSWRAQMLAAQVDVKKAIGELGFLVAGLFLSYLLSEYRPGLAIVVAAAMCGGAIYAVWRDTRLHVQLTEMIAAEAKAQQQPAPVPAE
jgi:hypothetical protein